MGGAGEGASPAQARLTGVSGSIPGGFGGKRTGVAPGGSIRSGAAGALSPEPEPLGWRTGEVTKDERMDLAGAGGDNRSMGGDDGESLVAATTG